MAVRRLKVKESAGRLRPVRKSLKESVRFPDLDERAMALYDARDYRGFSQFTDDELAKLASMCYTTQDNPWGRAYDDEVFDEIANRDTYDEIHAAGKRYAGIVESRTRRPSRRSMKEARYELSPQYDSRKSFYGKAHVVTDTDGTETLYSYNTPVVEIKDGKVKLLPMWDSSMTTLRHVKEFLQQRGFSTGSKSQIAKMYGESVNRRSHRKMKEWVDGADFSDSVFVGYRLGEKFYEGELDSSLTWALIDLFKRDERALDDIADYLAECGIDDVYRNDPKEVAATFVEMIFYDAMDGHDVFDPLDFEIFLKDEEVSESVNRRSRIARKPMTRRESIARKGIRRNLKKKNIR